MGGCFGTCADCWPGRARKAQAAPEPWHVRYGHTKPLVEPEKGAARLAYQKFLDEKQEEFKSKSRNDCPEEDPINLVPNGSLGDGTFGELTLAQHKKNGQYLCVEVIRKKNVLNKEARRRLILEKDLLYATANEFVVGLFATAKNRRKLYMVKELSAYGDFHRCVTSKMCLVEPVAKIYGAQIVLALEYLHRCHILHRDLKPERILVFFDRYIKLGDLSCAKIVPRSTAEYAGSPMNKAPEIIKRQMYSKAVDWWAFGVLLYQMISGKLPFPSSRPELSGLSASKIVRDDVKFGNTFSKHAKDLIGSLLEKRPDMRLGNLQGGADDIKDHPWFSDINFIGIYAKKYEIPLHFEPVVPKGYQSTMKPKKGEATPNDDDDDTSTASFSSFFRAF